MTGGEISFAASKRIEQQAQKREDEARALGGQVASLQNARDALLKEVTFLSSRNAQLEEEAASVPFLRAEVVVSRRKNDMLLALLGEKEEELEAMLDDMKEVKTLYRTQLNTLLETVGGAQQ